MYIVSLETATDVDGAAINYGYFEKEEDARNFCEKMNDYIKYLNLSSVLYRYTYDKVDPYKIDNIPLLNVMVYINKNNNNARIHAYLRLGGEELSSIDETQLTQEDIMVHSVPGVYSFAFYVKLDINKKLDDFTEELKNKVKELSSKLLDYEPETIDGYYSI